MLFICNIHIVNSLGHADAYIWYVLWNGWVIIGSGNGSWPDSCQAIAWTMLLIVLMYIAVFHGHFGVEIEFVFWWTGLCVWVKGILALYTSHYRPVAQIPQCTSPLSHNAPFCHRNVHMCAHFCYKMVHRGTLAWCIVGYMRWVYWPELSLIPAFVGNISIIKASFLHFASVWYCQTNTAFLNQVPGLLKENPG